MSNKELNVMILSGPSGIGKTRSLIEVKSKFESKDWEWFYGDCDELQGETAISFEPFLEAFKRLLKIDEFTNRGEQMESTMGSAVNMGAAIVDVDTSAFVKDYKRDGSQKMTEVCIEIIDELEKRNKKTIFVMEDLHWIDPESYSFLKLFVQMINRNAFLRGNMCIILSIRNDSKLSYRGPSIDQLKNDISSLQESSSFTFRIETLLGVESFNLFDFVKSLSTQENKFKIQNNSMVNINDVFNQAIDEYVVEYITPLYITKVLEKWIDDKVLIYTPEGYKLTTNISSQELPNETGVDSYYHNIIDKYDDKWKRLLESAAIIGNKFNADILASVWNYELLDVLSFLENAVEDKLLIDVSNEDNIYKFGEKDKVGSGKRIVSSI
jgi:predicted ATPase